MSFRPRMTAQTRAYRTLRPLSVRSWPGVVADVWHVHGETGGGGHYLSPDPRVVVFLGAPPRGMRLSDSSDGPPQDGVVGMYVPAGVPLWSEMTQSASFAHLDLHLDTGPLLQRLGAARLPSAAQLLTSGDRLQPIAGMLADEVLAPTRPAMMLDGLLSALLAEVLTLPAENCDQRGGLTPRQMAAIERHLDQHPGGRVSVADMADIAGLSESWFSRAFRKTTGEHPQRWLLNRRTEAARQLIMRDTLSLAEIAVAAGFADQAHLSRSFRAAFGQSPAQWRRSQRDAG